MTDSTTPKDETITCEDGQSLSISIYEPQAPIKSAVMIAPATGIKKRFYHAFATYLAEHGFGVVTFDNRGIGQSLTGHVKHSKATIRDWGCLDMPAVMDALKTIFPNTRYHVVGHSAGGQLTGLMSNYADIASQFNFACSSGQLDNMRLGYRLQAKFFMGVFAPLNNLLFGYTNTQWIGMGEPLPSGVAKDWCDWCNGAGYIATAFGNTVHEHWYNDIHCPSLWVNAIDDDIANNKNVDDMTRVYTQMPIERVTLSPSDYGVKEIGHMKFFSSKLKQLWPLATDWLDKHS